MSLKIAIQGGKASFHDIAAHDFFGEDITPVCCNTFREVCEHVINKDVDYALMAIENSIVGSILPNYSLIQEYDLHVVGEYKLRIQQNLMALPGQKIEDLRQVKSHYMALGQCQDFLSQYPHIVVEEFYDTADSARDIKERNLVGEGAIAGAYAAELYGLDILEESIETIKQNYTRFLVLAPPDKRLVPRNETDKATLSFELSHHVGSLAKALQIIVENEINLTKIQSIPIIGKPDQYVFYIDCTWSSYDNIKRCYIQLKRLIKNLTVLGEYKNWEIDYDNSVS